MSNIVIKQTISFILLILAQNLIFDNIHLFGLFNPFLYILFIINLPINVSRYLTLMLAFFLGLFIDIFSNTLGMHVFATVFVAYIRLPLLKLLLKKNDDEVQNLIPSARLMGFFSFLLYASVIVFIHHFILLGIDSLSFEKIGIMLLKVFVDSALTLTLILCLEIRKKN